MMMLGKGNTVLSLFVLLCGLVVTISAIDAGKLGITWNANLLTQPEDKPRERYGFSSVVEFNHDVAEFSDDDLVGLAIVAWNDMKKGFNDKPWTEDPYKREAKDAGRRPAVMTVIARGSRLYFASSVRTSRKRAEDPSGSDTLDWVESLDPIVRQGLIDCDVEAGNEDPGDGTGHGNNASCGEPIAMHIALRNGITAQGGLQGARVVTVKQTGVMLPCDDQVKGTAAKNPWGCKSLLNKLGLKSIKGNPNDQGDKGTNPNVAMDPQIIPVCI